ncbi:hypothetical protein [Rufibacter immobilis]|uniref:hypothetical protein n=1 Tax=Rufibacter immobilis TaxID=1348778 RepID=UPI0011CE9FE9|nr:hypothetical protein [Rufibacter immobilis]
MNIRHLLHNQKSVVVRVSLLYLFPLVGFGLLGVQPWVNVSTLTRDATAVAGGKFYHGLISNLGVLLWCATASVSLFSAWLLKARGEQKTAVFAFYAGLLSLFILLDDLFMLHEEAFPNYIGIPESVATALYPCLILAFLFTFRKRLLASSFLVLVSSLGFLGLSMLVDVVAPNQTSELEYLLEDGFKFMGIVGWFLYFVHTSTVLVNQRIQEQAGLGSSKPVASGSPTPEVFTPNAPLALGIQK